MKTLLLIMMICLSMFLSAQSEFKYCYLVVIEFDNNITVRKATDTIQLKTIVLEYYPNSQINVSEMFGSSVYFRIENNNKRFYVEKKRINKRGKLRKLRRKEIREIEKLRK